MTAPASQTRMCNGALIHLGETTRIGAINEGSPLAKLFEGTWDECRDEVLADHPWNFAIHREVMAADAAAAMVGSQWAFAFLKPAQMIRWLPWRSDHPDFFEGEEEGPYILSNAAAPICRFIVRIEDVARWSTGFKTAMTAKLAFKNAKAVTGQDRMIDRMAELYDTELSRGKRQDGHATGERIRTLDGRSDWLAARQRPFGR